MTTRSRSAARTTRGSTSGEGPLNVTLDANEDIVCTITNTRETGTIEVIKDLEPDGDPGRFNLQIDGTTEEGNARDGRHDHRAPRQHRHPQRRRDGRHRDLAR